nr:hypothetical protein [uncultured Enterobacter sp.]
MMRSEIEQLTDELIGEAVLSLLKEKGPISKQALVSRLRAMEASESDPWRRKALASVIAEISSNSVSSRRPDAQRDEKKWDSGNVYPLFGDQPQSVKTKKH